MTNFESGSCTCGRVELSVFLPKPLEGYYSRSCDCEFCRRRNLSYLSDPDGTLEITHHGDLIRHKQGSNQASFLSCPDCDSVVAVVCEYENGLKGAVNADLIDARQRLKQPVSVSPRLLSPGEKLIRWENVWFSVMLHQKIRTKPHREENRI